MDDTIHQLTTKFLKTLSVNLGKTTSKASLGGGNEVLADPTLQIIIHMISCTRSLRDALEVNTGGNSSSSSGPNSIKKPKNPIYSQLYQPMLNGILALLGKMLMDSFSFEPKVSDTAVFSAAYNILGRHILTLFPEMATKKHKVSGKMLIHHAVYKARPEIAEETVGHILKVSPISARAEDATGALPLHWATRNPDISFELIDVLLRSHAEAPSKADNKGFLPLHWAVNQDAPNVEVVRKLIKIFPAAAGMPSYSGNLPLHYCVSRARPSIPVIKALIAAYPEAIRSGCEDGYLPLHRYLNRPLVDLDALRLLINYYPDALLAKSNRNQTPLHVAVDHHSPDALAVDLLLQVCPSAISLADSDRYLPLHLCLDCAEPDYVLALQLLTQYPQAASCATKDDIFPLHLVVGANTDPTHEHAQYQHGGGSSGEGDNAAVAFVKALLQAHPPALVTTVKDIIPAMDGVALADPESWSGEWVESYWSPLTRARDRGLTGLVQLFQAFQQATSGNNSALSATAGGNKSQSAPSSAGNGNNNNSSLNNRNDSADKNETVAPLALWAPGGGVGDGDKDSGNPGGGGSGGGGSPQHEIIPFHQDFRPAAAGAGANNSSSGNNSNSNAGAIYNNNSNNQQYMSNAAVPVKSQPLNNNNSASASGGNNYNGVNPIRFTGPASPRGNNITINNTNNMHGYNETGNDSTNDEEVVITNRAARLSKPVSRVPPHILKAQAAAAASARASSAGGSSVGGGSHRGRGGPGSESGDSRASSREHERQRAQQQAYLQHQYQLQQQQRRAGSGGGNQSDSDFNTDTQSPEGGDNQLQEASLMMESVYSHQSRHSAGPERSRDSTPLRQQQNYPTSAVPAVVNKGPPPGPIPASLLQAAENNAMKHARAQQQHQQATHGSSSGDLSGRSSSKRTKPTAGVLPSITSSGDVTNPNNPSPQRVPRAQSYNNNNNNTMESPPPQHSQQQSEQQFASTTGLAMGRSTPGRYDASDNKGADSDNNLKFRVATAPAQGDRDRNSRTQQGQPRVLGFGVNAAWSDEGVTAANSLDAPVPAAGPAPSTLATSQAQGGNVDNIGTSNSNANNVAMNAKQQRLLQAQQQYMKRAAGSTITNTTSGGGGGANFNLVRTKPGADPQTTIDGADRAGLSLKPAPAAYHRTVANNHTSEILKSLGGVTAGKMRIHPVSRPVSNNNTNSSDNSSGLPNSNNVDEMV